MPEQNPDPLFSELALKKAAEETKTKELINTAFESNGSNLPIESALQVPNEPDGAKDVGGVSTNKVEKLPESPESTFMRDLKDWYGIFFKSHTSLFEFSKYYAKMRSYINKTTAKLPDKPDPLREEELLSNVITVNSTNANYTPTPDTIAGTAIPANELAESAKSSDNNISSTKKKPSNL